MLAQPFALALHGTDGGGAAPRTVIARRRSLLVATALSVPGSTPPGARSPTSGTGG
ncbi:hypothetical protein [Streptomyces sp. NPDC001508]|uniref:hypothetical protein n=1 Tax=Streptomyces sp. NPDC001508 TaxID=3154656 RepID=UPI00332C91E2